MNNQQQTDQDHPHEIDSRNGTRGLHHIPAQAMVLMPVSIEKTVWEYYAAKHEGIPLSELLTEVLRRQFCDLELHRCRCYPTAVHGPVAQLVRALP